MVEKNEGCVVSEQIGTVWGYEGVPKRRKEDSDDQNHFRWFQVFNQKLDFFYVTVFTILRYTDII